jgi:hypothetical protein
MNPMSLYLNLALSRTVDDYIGPNPVFSLRLKINHMMKCKIVRLFLSLVWSRTGRVSSYWGGGGGGVMNNRPWLVLFMSTSVRMVVTLQTMVCDLNFCNLISAGSTIVSTIGVFKILRNQTQREISAEKNQNP